MKKLNHKLFCCLAGLLFLFGGSLMAQPANNTCATAIPVGAGVTNGTTSGASQTPGLSFCGTSSTSPDVWYSFVSPGGTVVANTCTGTGYDSKITIWSGSCGALTCIGGNDDFCGLQSQAAASTTPGQQLFIMVHGFGGATGAFSLTLTASGGGGGGPANDDANGAIPVQCGDFIQGTTTGATVDAGLGFCGTSNGTAPGVWYQFIGNGDVVTANTCTGTSYDSKLSVFSGAPGALTCVTGNDDFCGLRSQVTFSTTPGIPYYILVHGFGSGNGAFGLTLSCVTPLGNDACTGAIPVACGDVIQGSTSAASGDGLPFCGTSNTAPGVWYSFVNPNGGPAIITTCSPNTNYDTKLQIWEGTCNGLICVTGNDDDFTCPNSGLQSNVQFVATAGVTYYVTVAGFGSGTGDFELSVSCPAPPANDQPCNADPLAYGVSPFNNQFATADPGEASPGAGTDPVLGSCNSQDGWCSFETAVASSIWYTIVAPNSGCINVTSSGFDTQLALYEVGVCGDYNTYTVVAANDDSGPGLAAAIIEASCLTPGATYYLQVDGFGTQQGAGTLDLQDCGGDLLALDAGSCQSRFVGACLDGLGLAVDTNYIVANATGGQEPYTFTISPAPLFSDGNQFAVQPDSSTTYTITVTDDRGCTETSTVDVNVIDVCDVCNNGNRSKKIQICHVPPGNPGNAHTICVSTNAVPAHFAPGHGHTGDRVGPCSNACLATNPAFTPPPPCVNAVINLSTDSFGGETSWTLTNTSTGAVEGELLNGGQGSNTTVSTTICVDPRDCYEFLIEDSFGDGICCGFGTGSYTITFDGNLVAESNQNNNAFNGVSQTATFGVCTNKSSRGDEALAGTSKNDLNVSVYPNPTNSVANFKFSFNENTVARIHIYSITGTRVATIFDGQIRASEVYTQSVDLGAFSDGLYLYRVETNSGEYKTGKIYLAQ